jgi:type II secretory pathway component GspD/PulD (secretin)
MIWEKSACRSVSILTLILAALLATAFTLPGAVAQTQPSTSDVPRKPDAESIRTFYIANSDMNAFNDIQTSLRYMLPKVKMYGMLAQYAITVRAGAEELEAAQKLIAAVDRPRKVYRLTYTITEVDAGKRTGAQHFVFLASDGQRSIFKQGSRIPVVTGVRNEHGDTASLNSEMQYMDVGLSIEATISGAPDTLNLRSKVEQSSPADELPVSGTHNPRFRQTVLDETFQLAQGKPLVLGSFDFPGTARHQEVEVVAELVR